MQLETMYSELNDRVAIVVLNRPEVLNCANEQWARDLNTIVDDLASNHKVRVVVLRGQFVKASFPESACGVSPGMPVSAARSGSRSPPT